MINTCIRLSSGQFPYKSSLSLLPIIKYWQEKANDKNPVIASLAREAEKMVQSAPELLAPITDETLIDQHTDTIELLMSAIFPQVGHESSLSAAVNPFGNYSFYHTPTFAASMLDSHKRIQYPPTLDVRNMLGSKVFYACSLILKQFYGVEVSIDKTSSFQVTDPRTGLDKYYKMSVDPRFIEVKSKGTPRALSDEQIQTLLNNFQDMDTWLQYLPPDNFEFTGFVIFSLIDITDQEVMSSLKYNLLEKESIISDEKFSQIQRKVRTLLKRPDVKLGIGAFQKRRNTVVNYGHKICHSFLFRDVQGMSCPVGMNQFYADFIEQSKPVIIENIATAPIPDDVKNQFVEQGIHNVVFMPLFYDEAMIGVLELGSPHAGDLHSLSMLKIDETLPLFSLAVKRSFEEMEARIEAIVKEKFTAIHPSVEWRFTEAAMNLLEKQDNGENAEIEPIVFNEVYPLYGASDIRNSSVERNKAIQQDLITQLTLAKRLLEEALNYQSLPILEKLNLATSRHMEKIRTGLLSDAEITVHDFLKRDIEPVIEHLAEAQPVLQSEIERYWHALDPELGVVYQKRKEFEESLTQINETLSAYIEEEEGKAQKMFPHYFEKYKTDGIEYNIYIGASLVEDMAFHSIYLKNLRLWQLLTMCEIAKRTKALKSQLKVHLETTQLILAHSLPLSIRFRMDERHFDVDGAYNIRYEIIKKRIDKAVIKGTNERLTQPGKIVIIYSQVNEGIEYNDYIEYLQEKNLLTNKVERVELEDLQGVQGLKAIRVEVNLAEAEPKKKSASKQIMEIVQAYAEG